MSVFISKMSVYRAQEAGASPKLEYVDPLFKRRLSQISRMTIEVVHNVKDFAPESKLVFASFRGEISRQLKINKTLIEDGAVLPASFSISVFNTPPAAASIALSLKAGYTAVYPSGGNFKNALISAAAPVFCNSEEKVIFAYADEAVPSEYKNVIGYSENNGLAFACILSSVQTEDSKELDLTFDFNSPDDFIKSYGKD